MAPKKPLGPIEYERRARALYDSERRTCRVGLFVGAPLIAAVLFVVKTSTALPIPWPLIIGPPVAVALLCCIGYGAVELYWWMHRRHVAQRNARGFEVLTDKPDENQKA